MAGKYRTQATINAIQAKFTYEPRTGRLLWKADVRGRGGQQRAGTVVIGRIDSQGYRDAAVGRVRVRQHIIAWVLMKGDWPQDQIDHRNRKRLDNRWRNLREATQANQSRNASLRSDNVTGYKGVVVTRGGRYAAHITHSGWSCYLGTFDTARAASAHRKEVAKKLHGSFYTEGRSALAEGGRATKTPASAMR